MQYTCIIDGDNVHALIDGQRVGIFDTDTFLLSVISPLEFKRFEKNPDKKKFYIRKLEFNIYNQLKTK